jgi:hypothetical protein
MGEQRNGRDQERMQPPEYEEPTNPHNPPSNVLPPSRRRALSIYLGGVVAFSVIIGTALVYWSVHDGGGRPVERLGGGRGGVTGSTPGGFDPAPHFRRTQDELEFRGVGTSPLGPMRLLQAGEPITGLHAVVGDELHAVIGRRIEVRDVEVDRIEDGTFWVRDGSARARVAAPRDSPAVSPGDRVNVSGRVEADDRGGVRIRATRVTILRS